ncbi:MAG: hypothetical protein J2P49_06565 [Methylocapsa sp.]|nr:hypothetical protein [Methylocapsa sp.]
MAKIAFPLAVSAVLLSSVCAAPVWALSAVTYVSGKGADTGACATPATACRTFQFAVAQTAPGGEVTALDPANYGPVTISKSISIEGVDGATIADIPSGGNGVTINAGPKDTINISRLAIDGEKRGQAGISFSPTGAGSFGSLTVAHSAVRNFCDGIDILGGASNLVKSVFLIKDVVVSDNNAIGLDLVGAPGTLDHVTVIHNGGGSAKCGTGSGSIRAAQGVAVVSIVDSTVANNSAPIDSEDGATIRLYLSFIPDGVGLAGGTAVSAGNNFIPRAELTEVGTH